MFSLLSDHAARGPKGLCSRRFRADFVTTDVDYGKLHVGDVVTVDGRELTIIRVGKDCHPECGLVRQGRVCRLKNNCAFAEIRGKDWKQ